MLSPGSTKHSSTFTGSETAANLNSANAKTVTVKAKWKSNCTENCSDLDLSVNESVGFSYTGAVKGVTLRKAGYYKLEVWGAQGGSGSGSYANGGYSTYNAIGGFGGYSYGEKNFEANTTIYVVVGGAGSTGVWSSRVSGGYNGGGVAGGGQQSAYQMVGGAGGGATHIATRTGVLSSLSSYKSSVLIVAGGGGGGGTSTYAYLIGVGGMGGGYEGARGGASTDANYSDTGYGGGGGTQSAGGTGGTSQHDTATSGTFGQGGCSTYNNDCTFVDAHGAGGGGGYYGGGGGAHDQYGSEAGGAGGGGSGYISGLSNARMYAYTGNYYNNSSYNYYTPPTSTTTNVYTIGTTSYGAHQVNAANTGNGYAKITYLGT